MPTLMIGTSHSNALELAKHIATHASAFSTTPCSSQLTTTPSKTHSAKFALRISAGHGKLQTSALRKIQRKSSHQQMILPPPLEEHKAVQPKQPMDRRSGRDRRQTVGQPRRIMKEE